MQCICTNSRNKRFHTIEYVPISKRISSRPESRVRVGLSWQVDVGHYCWKPSTATGCGQKKSVMAVCHCEQCAGQLTEDRRMPCLSNTPPQPQPTTTTTTTTTTNYQSNNHHSNTYPTLSPITPRLHHNPSPNIHWYQTTSCPCSTVQDCFTDCQRQDPRQHYAFEHLLPIGCYLSTLISQLRGPLQNAKVPSDNCFEMILFLSNLTFKAVPKPPVHNAASKTPHVFDQKKKTRLYQFNIGELFPGYFDLVTLVTMLWLWY